MIYTWIFLILGFFIICLGYIIEAHFECDANNHFRKLNNIEYLLVIVLITAIIGVTIRLITFFIKFFM